MEAVILAVDGVLVCIVAYQAHRIVGLKREHRTCTDRLAELKAEVDEMANLLMSHELPIAIDKLRESRQRRNTAT